MGKSVYETDPNLKNYFTSLPKDVQNRIKRSGVEISTLGELMEVGEHLKETGGIDGKD
ncbi:hypothetical protein [Caproiciproducens galactitolivorans]|uniref:Uncharacterized protein n=1 Tax=Caproiciproducens galactitolivorans TaxID=642589 RepID=A0ABT4BY95_9FIRM|nr:hypothetical protein [Caproiciproducens galactitolivorans]MCY1715300.1 hypothetical protein [Caproiciproducens galactitolivorans]